MKKVLFTLILTAFAGISMAQEQKATKTEKQNQNTEENAGTWNSYGGEWFFGVGAGAQYYIGDHNRQADIKDNLTPSIKAYVGRWFNPTVGMRLQYQGYQCNGLTQWGNYKVGEEIVFNNGARGYKQQFNYFNLSADVLFNMTQLIYGKGVQKCINVIPYLGAGWSYIYTKPVADSFTFGGGFLTTCKLAEHLNLVLDLHAMILQDKWDGQRGGRHGEGIVDASLGLNYHF